MLIRKGRESLRGTTLSTASRRLRRWICNRKETHVFVGLRLQRPPEPRPQGRRSRRPSNMPINIFLRRIY